MKLEEFTGKLRIVENEHFLSRWVDNVVPAITEANMRLKNTELTWKPKYFVHRDVYGDKNNLTF
ncbi:hypothetical protein BpHYR1_024820 [Brachionus plicatilis]|uniref:Uncharacterized protein n=1 Tax=Brachionus plicatilis TaxID=10195 RepID=A0A3M7PP54_BRAPC|nr:hypothetical protein BpHYR1_024820 [Brachionus plicatilis]